jgi:hypothetical protein
MIRKSLRPGLIALAVTAAVLSPRAAQTERLATAGAAFVEVDRAAERWTIGNDEITCCIRLARGITADLGALAERELAELYQEIELAKRLREALGNTTTYGLTPQTREGGQWRVVQEVSWATGTSAIFAFADGSGNGVRVVLREIRREATYELRSADRGRLGLVRGADLTDDGLGIRVAPESSAQVLMLEPVATAGRVK